MLYFFSEKRSNSYLISTKFYSNVDMEDISDSYYMFAKRVCKDFEAKNVGKYLYLYLKCDTLLFADIFENFRKFA